jgi:hypothetical protein
VSFHHYYDVSEAYSLPVGACFGRIIGLMMDHLQWRYPDAALFAACNGKPGCVVPGIYAMVSTSSHHNETVITKLTSGWGSCHALRCHGNFSHSLRKMT